MTVYFDAQKPRFFLKPGPGLTEVSRARHKEVIAELSQGGKLSADQNDEPIVVPDVLSVDKAKQLKLDAIEAALTAATQGGFHSSALGAEHFYSSSPNAQIDLIGAAQLDTDMPYLCTDDQGVKDYRMHTAAQIKQVLADAGLKRQSYLQQSTVLISQVNAAATAIDVQQISVVIS